MRSSQSYTTPVPPLLQFAHQIVQMGLIHNCLGHQKSSIVSRGVIVSETIAISLTHLKTVISKMRVNFPYHSALTRQLPRHHVENQPLSYYLDIVHIDIAFRDCALIGGYKYALVFINCATRYNWTFGLKSLQHKDIIAAFLLFRGEAGSLSCHFRCNCDEKLFSSSISLFRHTNNSSIALSLAGQQSGNGLVESNCKVMVHMA
jgi:hypothetical protein